MKPNNAKSIAGRVRRPHAWACLLILLGVSSSLLAEHPDRKLLDAIMEVESGGDVQAVGDGGASVGPYQISRAYWTDGCKQGVVDWDYDKHVRDIDRCEYVIYHYWQRYGAKTDEQKARMHNGGPRGHKKKATLKYWEAVQEQMP